MSGRRAQSSLEMTLAMIGALVLLFGSIKVFIWLAQRLVARQQAYENTRVAAGSSAPGRKWDEPSQKLSIFGN